jgi:hypothetical protein
MVHCIGSFPGEVFRAARSKAAAPVLNTIDTCVPPHTCCSPGTCHIPGSFSCSRWPLFCSPLTLLESCLTRNRRGRLALNVQLQHHRCDTTSSSFLPFSHASALTATPSSYTPILSQAVRKYTPYATQRSLTGSTLRLLKQTVFNFLNRGERREQSHTCTASYHPNAPLRHRNTLFRDAFPRTTNVPRAAPVLATPRRRRSPRLARLP